MSLKYLKHVFKWRDKSEIVFNLQWVFFFSLYRIFVWLFYLEISSGIFKNPQKLPTFISVHTNLDINIKVSNVYLNVKIRSLIHLTALIHNSLSLRNLNCIFDYVKPHTANHSQNIQFNYSNNFIYNNYLIYNIV